MKSLVSFALFVPSIAIAADDVDQGTFLFAALVAAAIAVYVLCIKPEQFRERLKKRLPKFEKYVGRISQQSDHAKTLSDGEIWSIIEEALILRGRIAIALFPILCIAMSFAYPAYAPELLGDDPPYWRELVVGLVGGAVICVPLLILGRAAFRMRIAKLVGEAEAEQEERGAT